MAKWKETYAGGSPEAERTTFGELAELMLEAQLKSRKAAGAKAVDRAFHAKSIAAFGGATLRFVDDLPPDLQVGFTQPGAEYPVEVRFSNAASTLKSDDEKDLRGLGLRIAVSKDEHHDLLATNFAVPHARDAYQFVTFAHAVAGGTVSRVVGIGRLLFVFGPSETLRIIRNLREALRVCESLAFETYWSRGAIRWGDEAVRYFLRPLNPNSVMGEFTGPARLEAEFAARLAMDDVQFELCVQRFIDEATTPIEDAATEWRDVDSPPVRVAVLTLPERDLSDVKAIAERRRIEDAGFNPWNTTEEFRPLGNLNRARKAAYDASLAHRQRRRWKQPPAPVHNRLVGGSVRAALRRVNRRVPWHRMPYLISLLNLDALRHDLRTHNLIDTQPREAPPKARALPGNVSAENLCFRSYTGDFNDMSDPAMGARGSTFGRNMPPQPQSEDNPNPVMVARELLDRKSFIPARSLNILAAAWIQFQVHDWVSHARKKLGENDTRVTIPDKYPDWKNEPGAKAGRDMLIAGNVPHPSLSDVWLAANDTSHWWDGSEVYGTNKANANKLRESDSKGNMGSRLRLDGAGYLPTNVHGFEATGFNESWWLGLSAMHTLFAREHNVICDELERTYPLWSPERVYQTARLIVSALIAKIHTVEWTPAILGTKALEIGMNTNWYGPPSDAWFTRLGLWLTDTHALKGIPQTYPIHHSAPYSLTEEFATVYRMHPLIPDDYVFYDYETGAETERTDFLSIQGAGTDEKMRALGLRNTLYSFGIAYPGAITLHNFPKALQNLERSGEMIDLSVIDIVRTRARHVPRYNGFRKGLHMPPITRFEDMTASPETNRILKDIYGHVDKVDTVVGLLGEAPPDGFGFSDTAFRVFILMASRRLQSDRFLNADFRPEIYSPLGMDWVANNTMTTVLLRHCPELGPVLPTSATAFAPWRPVH